MLQANDSLPSDLSGKPSFVVGNFQRGESGRERQEAIERGELSWEITGGWERGQESQSKM